MLVRIDNDTAVDMLMDRLSYWTDDEDVHALYRKMYTNSVENGCFDGREFDIREIVDNDYVNWCSVIDESDEAYEEIKKLYDDDEYDVSCIDCGYSYIEAEHNGYFLMRC